MTTPYETVKAKYRFPPNIEERAYQVSAINALAPLPRAGYYLGIGTGKTFVSTCSALYKRDEQGADVTWIVMPPILLVDWYRWLSSITPKQHIMLYAGSPAERKRLNFDGYDWIMSSIQIFKKDYSRIVADLTGKKVTLIVDEATSIKNVGSENHKTVRDFVMNQGADLLPLTGTPLSTPLDGYAFIKLIAPTIYRNLNHFENVHVAERDFFDKPIRWKNLDLLAENMQVNSVRFQRREVVQNLPPVIFTPIEYALDVKHYQLYRELVENQLLELPDGGKIDATAQNALYHKTQQIVCNWDYFSGDDANIASGLELVEEVLSELGDGKLVVVGNYRMTNRKLVTRLAKYGAVAAFGDITPAQQARNKDRFIDDPACRIFILQPASAGFGLDGMQRVCSDMLFLELPRVPRDFHQTVGRLDRDGQADAVQVRVAIAQGTVQIKLMKDMMHKDEVVGRVQPNVHNLRKELMGDLT